MTEFEEILRKTFGRSVFTVQDVMKLISPENYPPAARHALLAEHGGVAKSLGWELRKAENVRIVARRRYGNLYEVWA